MTTMTRRGVLAGATALAAGAALSLSISSMLNWGGHAQASGALGILLLTFLVSAAAAVIGAVAGMFQKVRLIGIALLSAGLGGLLSTIAFFFWRITR